MNGITLSRCRLLWPSIHKNNQDSSQRYLWFFLKDEEFIFKTINNSNIDLDKFPASKVRQLAKKMESSKVTARHIKQVVSNLHVAQINLMQHQHKDLPEANTRKGFMWNLDHWITRMIQVTNNQYLHTTTRTILVQKMFTGTKRDVRNVVILYM